MECGYYDRKFNVVHQLKLMRSAHAYLQGRFVGMSRRVFDSPGVIIRRRSDYLNAKIINVRADTSF